jgi:hypothetical protein
MILMVMLGASDEPVICGKSSVYRKKAIAAAFKVTVTRSQFDKWRRLQQQTHKDEPTVRIKELKKDGVYFVLENVDLAYGCTHSRVVYWSIDCLNKVCKHIAESHNCGYT